ncbi:MAG: hypothetical protein EYC62_06230 [Alphaproteobacteria bacterium]|nr:MAG: hypothetical protein EYC62_06230 [Alphaproteobacteria bacterium]
MTGNDFPTRAGTWVDRVEAAKRSYVLLATIANRLGRQFPLLDKGYAPTELGDLTIQQNFATAEAAKVTKKIMSAQVMQTFAAVGLISYFIIQTGSLQLVALYAGVSTLIAGRKLIAELGFNKIRAHVHAYFRGDNAISVDPNQWIKEVGKDSPLRKEINSYQKMTGIRFGIALLAFWGSAAYNYYHKSQMPVPTPTPAVVPQAPLDPSLQKPSVEESKPAPKSSAIAPAILWQLQNAHTRG